ncbi:glycosyltransferase family 2 protein [Sphingomonas immobilis]|uniref:Glycosyltransferase n=1 Tax=Sphingomonas immobilis TaxID=3063997 RepID=A0ABT8ZZ17_9SPHN|nr:glycosyltransferase [Sphingomonas sp. CA1-15]MDO7841702.1 glycosyltransferase [Sphingomonas sp. CA1-15]
MTTLSQTLHRESPRYTPRAIGWPSRLIGAFAPILFIALIVQAFERQGVAVWSVGIAYILYDTMLLVFTAWNIRDLAVAAPVKSGAWQPSLGVIVAAHNEAGVLDATIARLAGQSDPPDLILIADDGSSDATPQVLARYGLDIPAWGEMTAGASNLPSLRWLRLPHGGKARALNAAIERVDTHIVITVDADTLLQPGAIGAMRAAFVAEPELVAATGVLAPICGPDLQGRLFEWFQSYEYVRNFLSRHAWQRLDSLLLISGAFAAFRRDAVVAVGGFDDDCMVEDYELIHRLQRHAGDHRLDWRVRVVGGALAYTDAPASPMAFLRQRRRWFGGFLQTQWWNRDMVGNRRYGWLGMAMLPVKALDTLQPIYGLVAFAILVTLVATGKFTIALPILIVMIAKIVVDLSFHLWSLGMYKRWTGQREGLRIGPALVASLAEPFTFQLLRHAGAVWGWWAFLNGGGSWGKQHRTAIVAGART